GGVSAQHVIQVGADAGRVRQPVADRRRRQEQGGTGGQQPPPTPAGEPAGEGRHGQGGQRDRQTQRRPDQVAAAILLSPHAHPRTRGPRPRPRRPRPPPPDPPPTGSPRRRQPRRPPTAPPAAAPAARTLSQLAGPVSVQNCSANRPQASGHRPGGSPSGVVT